jgi:hypothetical protein
MVDVYLGEHHVGVCGPDGQATWFEVASLNNAMDVLAQQIELAIGRRPVIHKPRIRVWLSGALARPFLLEPVPGISRWAEAYAVAQSLVLPSTGLQGPCTVWLDQWRENQACVAVAAQDVYLNALLELEASHRWLAHSVRPWWSQALAVALKGERIPEYLSVEDTDALVELAGKNGTWVTVNGVVPRPDAAQGIAMVRRGLLRAGVAPSQGQRIYLEFGTGDSKHGNETNVAGFRARQEWLA